jgi:hypothetical protein
VWRRRAVRCGRPTRWCDRDRTCDNDTSLDTHALSQLEDCVMQHGTAMLSCELCMCKNMYETRLFFELGHAVSLFLLPMATLVDIDAMRLNMQTLTCNCFRHCCQSASEHRSRAFIRIALSVNESKVCLTRNFAVWAVFCT